MRSHVSARMIAGVALCISSGYTATADTPADAITARAAVVPAVSRASSSALTAGQAALKAVVAAYGGDAFLAITTITATGTGEIRPPGFGIRVNARAVKLSTISPDRACAILSTAIGAVTVASPGGGKKLWYEFAGIVHDIALDDLVGDPTAIIRVAIVRGYTVRDDGLALPSPSGLSDPASPPEMLAIIDSAGHVTHLTVNPATHLVQRVDVDLALGGTARFDLSDYALVVGGSGVVLPGTVVSSLNGDKILTVKLKDFALNKPVDDKIFVRPPDPPPLKAALPVAAPSAVP